MVTLKHSATLCPSSEIKFFTDQGTPESAYKLGFSKLMKVCPLGDGGSGLFLFDGSSDEEDLTGKYNHMD